MMVYVDDKQIEVFEGATAADAARACQAAGGTAGGPVLYDAYGNEIAADSPMAEGRKIFTRNTKD